MDLHALKNEGWTNKEIAEELGYHSATVAKWLEAGGPPKTAVVCDERRVMTSVWRARIEVLLGTHPRLLATSVHNKLRAEGSVAPIRRWCGQCARSAGLGSGRPRRRRCRS